MNQALLYSIGGLIFLFLSNILEQNPGSATLHRYVLTIPLNKHQILLNESDFKLRFY